MTEALLEQPTELSTLNQPVDLFELERQRHFNLANSVVLAMTEGFGDTVDSREFMYDDASFGLNRVGQAIAYTSRNDRDDGKYLPIFQNGMELSAIRAEARNITAMSGGIMGAIGTLTNYTFGVGFTFAAQRAADCPASVPTETTDALSLEAQQIINLFLLQNKFQSDMDREIDWRAREDGEVFVEVYQSPAGQIRASFCEPDAVCEPANPNQLDEWLQDQDPVRYSNEWLWSWSFGVHGIRRCPDDPQGFHVVYDQSGEDWEYVPSSRMLHIKRNVPRNVKRGVSDLYWVANDVLRETKIRRNTADAAALQAAIAWIRQHAKGTTPAAVQTMVTGQTVPGQPQRATPGTSTTKRGKLNAGTVLDIPEGQEYLPGPMGAERNANFILIAQYVNRAIATRWAMPEFMFTSDASNSNFASTLVAESPFVKAREADQRFYGSSFVELLWKVLRMAHELGRFARGVKVFEDLLKILDVTATGPRVAVRDEYQTVQRQKMEVDMGTLSLDSAAAEMGRKLAEEQVKGAKPAGGADAGPGVPGQPSEPGPDGNPVPTAGAEHVGLKLSAVNNINKLRDRYLTAFKAGKADEQTTRLSLDALGIPAAKIDLWMDADSGNDPVDDEESAETAVEEIDGEVESNPLSLSLLECGGKGGEPGPCPTAVAKSSSGAAAGSKADLEAKYAAFQHQQSLAYLQPTKAIAPTAKPAVAKTKPAAKAAAKPAAAVKPAVPTKPAATVAHDAADRSKSRTRTASDMHAEGKQLQSTRKLGDSAAGISEQHGKSAVKAYTSNDNYVDANRSLRAGGDIANVPPKPAMAHLNHLASQPLAKPVVTYRGITNEVFESQYAKLGAGGEIHAKGFVSTSLDPGVATSFADGGGKRAVVLEIKAKRGLYVDDLSQFKGEHEIVQAHGTRYRMIGVEHGVAMGKGTASVVRLEEI